MAAAEAHGAWGEAALSATMATGQGTASPGEALASVAPSHVVAREADGWRQGQAGGAGGFCSAVAQPPLLEGADRECMPCCHHGSVGSVPELHSHVFLSRKKKTAPARFDSNYGHQRMIRWCAGSKQFQHASRQIGTVLHRWLRGMGSMHTGILMRK